MSEQNGRWRTCAIYSIPYFLRYVKKCLQARYNKGVCNRKAETSGVCVPVLTPENVMGNKQGIFVQLSEELTVYAVWYEKYQCYIAIRKLTPRECFRLQGWSDEYFNRAELVNSDSQLYKQAGNGVTVPVIYEIAKRMRANGNISARIVWSDRNGK